MGPQLVRTDAYAGDETTKVSIKVTRPSGSIPAPSAGNADVVECDKIESYEYTSDVLSLGDPCGFTLANPAGALTNKIRCGDLIKVFMADPNVAGGETVRKLVGRVISRRASSERQRGSLVVVGAADLGWHLQSSCARLHFRVRGKTFAELCKVFIDPSWGFAGVRLGNSANVRVKQGRAELEAQVNPAGPKPPPPVFQVEAGETVADKLLDYAQRERVLLNVSADGYLQIWTPSYDAAASYKFRYYSDDSRVKQNNVESAVLDETIDGLYTNVTCVGQVLSYQQKEHQTNNPNEGKRAASYVPSDRPLTFNRILTYGDGEAVSKAQALDRARRKYDRGLFDSWTYTVVVKGHQQGGVFYEADTMADVDDQVHGFAGKFYVSAVRYSRDRQSGTRTTLTLKKPNLLTKPTNASV